MKKRLSVAECRAFSVSTLGRMLPPMVLFASLANLLCLLLAVSNTTPLFCLTLCGILTFVLPDRPKLSWYAALPFLFVLYLYLHNIILFPETTSFLFRRRALFAFIAGIALFYALRSIYLRHFYLMLFLVPCVYGAVYLLGITGFISPSTFVQNGRLSLVFYRPHALGFTLATGLVAGLSLLFSSQKPVDCPSVLHRLLSPQPSAVALLFFILISFGLLIATLTRAALFSMMLVGACLGFSWLLSRISWKRAVPIFILLICLFASFLALDPLKGYLDDNTHSRLITAMKAPWKDPTFKSRIPLWTIGVAATRENPFFGKGPENYKDWHTTYVAKNYDALVSKYGKALIDSDTKRAVTPHNQFLYLSTEYGIIACLIFGLLIIIPFGYAVRYRTWFGEIIPLLSYFFLYFFFDQMVGDSRHGFVGTTVLFMIFGYFSCLPAVLRDTKGLVGR